MSKTFRGLVLEENQGKIQSAVRRLSTDALMDGDVLVAVAYSDVNYKDGLALLGKNNIVRKYPMIPGIDFAGVVEESASPLWKPGDEVILTGWGVGERHYGGYAQRARVKGEWLVPLPKGMSARQAMALGTAGFTAMLSVLALEKAGVNRDKPIIVTGASGGVGSVATLLLASRGYIVYASTGRKDEESYLKQLGAEEVIPRLNPGRGPLAKEQWGGAIDSVGGETLATVLSEMFYGSSVAACGLAGGTALPTTVFPFILRGVNLLGIDSVYCPAGTRRKVWEELAKGVDFSQLELATKEVSLNEVAGLGPEILQGKVRGRTVINIGID